MKFDYDNKNSSLAIEDYKINKEFIDEKASLFKKIGKFKDKYVIGNEYTRYFIPWGKGSIAVLSLDDEKIGDYMYSNDKVIGEQKIVKKNVKVIAVTEVLGKKLYHVSSIEDNL